MNLQFHLEAFDDSYFYVDKKVDHVSSPPTFLLSLPFLNDNTKRKKKATETSHKKFSEGKQVHVGMEASKTNQTRWE